MVLFLTKENAEKLRSYYAEYREKNKEKIAENYKSLMSLINVYNTSDKITGENLLADIKLSDKRKIGKVLSKKIYYSFIDSNNTHELEECAIDNDEDI